MALEQWTNDQVFSQLNSGQRWSGSTISYAFSTSAAGSYDSSGAIAGFSALIVAEQSAAKLALTLWDDLIVADMQQVAAGTSYSTANIEFGMSSSMTGYAYAWYPSVGSVWFNSDYASGGNSLTNPAIGKHGFLTYVHEIGHAMGLEHMGNYDGAGTWTPSSYQDSTVYSVMSYFGPNWNSGSGQVAWADWMGSDGVLYSPQTPILNDIYAMQRIYGVETTTRVGDTVYGFNSTVTDTTAPIYNFAQNYHPVLAIFDSAGIDTLDLSGWNTASVINLAPGSFSSCNAMTNNISIAYSCNIENAVGGGGADTISGNTLNNRLTGGTGNDTIYALTGDDIVIGGLGNDTIDGGDGVDTAAFTGNRSDYVVTAEGDSFRLIDQRGGSPDGSDVTIGIEKFQFADGLVLAPNLLTQANTAPVAKADTANTTEDLAVTITVLGNDSDVDGNTLSVSSAGDPPHGTVVVNGNGTITYTPDANYNGQDSFSYTIADGRGGTASATITVNVAAANDLPDAMNDTGLSTAFQTALVTPAAMLMANDIDIDGDTLTISSVQGATHGTVALANGKVAFTPDAGYSGSASYTYTVSDGHGGSDTGTVSLTVSGRANTAPVAVADTYATSEDTKLTVNAATGVLAADTDAEGGVLTAQIVATAQHGTLALAADGSFTYVPDANYSGFDSFTYRAKDGAGALSSVQTVTLGVAAANDLPDAVADSASTKQGTAVTIAVLANDTDVDGDKLSVTGVGSAHGTVVIDADGTVTYTPTTGYSGADTFNYTVSDGEGGTDTASVTIAVVAPSPAAQTVLTANQSYGVIGFAEAPTDTFVTGTAIGHETLTIGDNSATTLSNNFSAGGDTIRVTGAAADFKIAVSGNQVTLISGTDHISIVTPVGFTSTTIAFESAPGVFADMRILTFVADGADADALPDLYLGSQSAMPDLAPISVVAFA